jgi:hypothetical protein
MQDRQRNDQRRAGNRPTGEGEQARDAGAYIGRKPERATETIPGGLGPKDVRVSAVATQPAPVRGETPADGGGAPPEGHREGVNATDDVVREAGQNR